MSLLGKLISDLFFRCGRDERLTASSRHEHRFPLEVSCSTSIFLYVGCGLDRGANIRHGFADGWKEIRFDIDPRVQPDIVGSMLDMSSIPEGTVDVVYTSHVLEHLYYHEMPKGLAEMRRVLKPDGMVVAIVPDLQSTATLIAEDRLFDTLFASPDGPIAPFDVLYGHRGFVAAGNSFMAHKSGFTLSSLSNAMRSAGFRSVAGVRREFAFDLGVIATCQYLPEAKIRSLVENHLPI